MRLSIPHTYDSRETGPRFSVSTFVDDVKIKEQKVYDPFVRTSVHVSIWDAIKSILKRGYVRVEITVDGDRSIIEDVLELDANYLGHGNSRREEFRGSIESALSQQ